MTALLEPPQSRIWTPPAKRIVHPWQDRELCPVCNRRKVRCPGCCGGDGGSGSFTTSGNTGSFTGPSLSLVPVDCDTCDGTAAVYMKLTLPVADSALRTDICGGTPIPKHSECTPDILMTINPSNCQWIFNHCYANQGSACASCGPVSGSARVTATLSAAGGGAATLIFAVDRWSAPNCTGTFTNRAAIYSSSDFDCVNGGSFTVVTNTIPTSGEWTPCCQTQAMLNGPFSVGPA